MPPKKKTNGFMIFTFEWKEKYGRNMSLGSATTEAGKIWANMSAQERGPYNDKAKDVRVRSQSDIANEKMTCTGVPLSFIEKEKLEQEQNTRAMKKNIEKMVRNSVKKNEIATQKYYFVMVNYFTKALHGGVYIPAEISICEYSLQNGLNNKYHSFINPGINIHGHTYEAQNHSDTTHQLPLPPNAMGEADLGKLYNSILHFIRPNDDGEYPPLFTHRDSLPIVESVMNFLRSDAGANNVNLKIYSIQYLFFTLKEATCEIGEIEKPASIFITDAYFDRDIFEYMVGIACAFHEARDKNNYCTLSCVTRWCYAFSEYMTSDIAIKCIPGRHLPANTKTEPAPSTIYTDNESIISAASDSTYVTKALSEHKLYYDDQKSNASSRRTVFNQDDFPDLNGRMKPKQRRNDLSDYLGKSDDSQVNLWAERSRNVPPPPDESLFKIDVSHINDGLTDLNDADDASSVSGFGRGRLFKASFGRGSSYK